MAFFNQSPDKISADMPGSTCNKNRHLKPIIA
jgi:hypothetical protein